MARGGGDTRVLLASDWVAGVRWGRNTLLDTTEATEHRVNLARYVETAASGWLLINEITDDALLAALRRAERLVVLNRGFVQGDVMRHAPMLPALEPALFDDTTYATDGATRVTVAEQLIAQATAAGLWSAGYLEMSGHSLAIVDTLGNERYFRYTWAQCNVTVRDPAGTGSGWAGMDRSAWRMINPTKLGKIALDKCLQSRNPVRVEPGRYTTILEPQAAFDLVCPLFGKPGRGDDTDQGGPLSRSGNEDPNVQDPFWKNGDTSRLGERVADARLTIGVDPMDPELGFPPWRPLELYEASVFTPGTIIKDGVLTALPYDRRYGATKLGQPPFLWSGTFRMSGGPTSVNEMIASTTRGILVTRFDSVRVLNQRSMLLSAYTRDGTWLIENGKLAHPIVNLAATESVLFLLNNIDQLGVPQRVFNPPATWLEGHTSVIPKPAIVPPMKIKDFSFTSLIDAV
jgi:predicted Zn-dependent protease